MKKNLPAIGSDMEKMVVNFNIPKGWRDLSEAELRYVFELIASGISSEEMCTTCMLKWGGVKVIGRQSSGVYLLQKDSDLFEVGSTQIAELLPQMEWLANLPEVPVRLPKIGDAEAVSADFQGVPFKTFIIADNLYQGYLHTQNESMLDDLAEVLYGARVSLNAAERISIFYWMAALKLFLSKRFSDFFQPIVSSDTTSLGLPPIGTQLQEAMDAQIRALTKGDITKEAEILELDTWRALTELNAQAREYKQIKSTYKK